jgi:hypothetical protein
MPKAPDSPERTITLKSSMEIGRFDNKKHQVNQNEQH